MPAPLEIQSVNHVARLTSRLEQSKRFYRDVIGFREIERPNFKFPGAWLYGWGLQLHLIVDEDAPDPTGDIKTRCEHMALHVPDTDEAQRRLTEHGVEFVTNYVADRDVTQIFCRDPDGHHVELGCYPPLDE